MGKLLPLVFTLCIFLLSACNDNNESWESKKAKEITNVYRDSNLQLTYNGKKTINRPITIVSEDNKTADINLMYLITGEKNLTLKGVELNEVTNGEYTFEAEDINNDRTIKISGSISATQDKVLTLDVEFESKAKVIGKWTLKPYNFITGTGSLDVQISPKDMVVNMYGVWNEEQTNTEMLGGIFNLVGGLLSDSIDLKFEFEKSGEMNVAWSSKAKMIPFKPGKSESGILKFNTNNDNLYMSFALDSIKMTKAELSEKDILALVGLAQNAYNGLPLKVEYIDTDNIALYVNKELMLPYIETIIKLIKPTLASTDYGPMGAFVGLTKESVPLFADEIVRLVKEADQFDIKLLLQADNNSPAPAHEYTWRNSAKTINNHWKKQTEGK